MPPTRTSQCRTSWLMQNLSNYWITVVQDIYKHISLKWGTGDHCWIWGALMYETSGRGMGRKGTVLWSLTSANFRLISLTNFSEGVWGGRVWNECFFSCRLMDVQYEQITSRHSLLQAWDMFFPFVSAVVQEKFHRIIQLQEGNKQHDAFCSSGSLSMNLSDVTFFVKATAVRQIDLLTW